MTFCGTQGSQGDRLIRPHSLYCHSLGKAGRRARISCHQMLVIMTNDEVLFSAKLRQAEGAPRAGMPAAVALDAVPSAHIQGC